MRQINVGIIGFGTVGAGTVEVLLANRDLITGRVGSEIVIKRIADLDLHSDRGLTIDQGLLTTEAMVAEKPDEKREMHPGTQGMGGGMGGMM